MHAMEPRAGSWGQVARNEFRMGLSAEVTGIESILMRVQGTGTQAEVGRGINQGRMKEGRVNSDGAAASRLLEGGAVDGWLQPELANRGDSWWFALPKRVKRPQEKPPWFSSCGLKVSARFSPPASIDILLSETGAWGRNGLTIELFLKDLGRNLVVGRLRAGVCIATSENFVNSQYTSLPSLLGSDTSTPNTLKMAPRLRATPRRGRNAGHRGGTGGRGRSPPRRISPIAMAYPSTQVSEDSESSLNNSVQTTKFRFKSRLHNPIVTAMVTVIFSEEEEKQASSENSEREHSPTPQEASLQKEDTISTQSTSTDQSHSPRISAVQCQMENYSISQMKAGTEEKAKGMAEPQQGMAQSDQTKKWPDNPYCNLLQLRLPPGVKPTDVQDGLMVEWVRETDEEKDPGDDAPG